MRVRSRPVSSVVLFVAVLIVVSAQPRASLADLADDLRALDNIHKVAVSPDGREVWAYGSHSRVIAVANVGSGTDQVINTIRLSGDNRAPVSQIVFSPDGRRAYLGNTPQYCSDGPPYIGACLEIVIIDAVAKRIEAMVPMMAPWQLMESLAISPDGATLFLVVTDFSAGRDALCVFDALSLSIRGFVELPGVNHVVVSKDGKYLYCTRGSSYVGPSPDLLSVLDTSSMQVLYSVPTGKEPYSVAVTQDGARAVVPNAGSRDVSLIDLMSRTVTATIQLGVLPHEVVLTPDGTKAYIGTFRGSDIDPGMSVAVIDMKGNVLKKFILVDAEPQWVTVASDGRRVYVSDGNANGTQASEFHVLDAVNEAYLRPVILRPGAHYTPTGIAVLPDGGRAFVIAEARGTVVVMDIAHRAVIAELSLRARALAVSRDGKRLFVFAPHLPSHSRGRLLILDTTTLATLDSVELGDTLTPDAWESVVDRIVLDHAETTAFLTCGDPVQVLAVDLAGHRVLARIPVASTGINTFCRGLALSPDERRLFTTDMAAGTLVVIDTATRAVVTTIPVGNEPSEVLVSADGRRVSVLQEQSNTLLSVFDADNLSLVRKVHMDAGGAGQWSAVLSDDERLLTVACFDPNWVMVFDTEETNPASQIKALLKTGLDPHHLALSGDGRRLFVTNFTSDSVSIIDRQSNRIVDTISLAPRPSRYLRRAQ